jgi:hypothetical protein
LAEIFMVTVFIKLRRNSLPTTKCKVETIV